MVSYNICMFAYNEEKNIEQSVASIRQQCSENLNKFYLIANGCKDRTVEIVKAIKSDGFAKLELVEIELGDKCNAWNHYIHELADEVDVHFFVDADVRFSENCFDRLSQHLMTLPERTVTVAGLPLSGRNRSFYESLVKDRSCFFGNLYGLKQNFVERIKANRFKLPIGLNWIDSFLTKSVNTDLSFSSKNLPERVTYLESVGYRFDNLSPFSLADIKLYISRIARYELGKIQEKYLDRVPLADWPNSMFSINQKIDQNFINDTEALPWIKRLLVRKRLTKLLQANK